jgi:hypothetical protein
MGWTGGVVAVRYSEQAKDTLFSKVSRWALGPAEPRVQWVPGPQSPGFDFWGYLTTLLLSKLYSARWYGGWIRNDFVGSGRGVHQVLFWYLPARTEENHKEAKNDRWSDKDSNPPLLEYKL